MTILIEQDDGTLKRYTNVLKYMIYNMDADYSVVSMDISISQDWCYRHQLKIEKNTKIIIK